MTIETTDTNFEFLQQMFPVFHSAGYGPTEVHLIYKLLPLFQRDSVEYFATTNRLPDDVDKRLAYVRMDPNEDGDTYELGKRLLTDAEFRTEIITFWKEKLATAYARSVN